MPEVRILRNYCKGCGLCVDACPAGCLRMGSKINAQGIQMAEVVETATCIGCLQCHAVCPDVAIEIYVTKGQSGMTRAALVRAATSNREGGADDGR